MEVERDSSAQEVLEVIPMAMRFIRAQMRKYGSVDLSVPQFRSLMFLRRHAGSSLGGVAEHLGMTPPSASKLIDCLERRKLVERKASPSDRRMVTLGLTTEGNELLDQAIEGAQKSISATLAALEPQELSALDLALAALKRILSVTKHDPG